MQPTLVIVSAVMFLAAILLVEGGVQLFSALRDPEARKVNRRLRLLDSGYDPEEIYRLLRRKREETGWARFTLLRDVNVFLQQAGITTSIPVFLIGFALAVVVLGLLGVGLANLHPVVAFGGAAVLLAALAFFRISTKRKARLATLENQLPEMLDLIVRSVRSGHPLNTALRLASDELPEPLGSEVGLVVDETTYGVSLVDAVDNLAERIGLNDYNYFAVVAKITSKTGGNLATILDNLANVMRERNRMRRKIKAISSEGRASGLVMSLAPPAIAGIIMLLSPEFFMAVADDPLFRNLMIFVVFMCVTNVLVLRKLVNFDF